jgi:hypothetical protein
MRHCDVCDSPVSPAYYLNPVVRGYDKKILFLCGQCNAHNTNSSDPMDAAVKCDVCGKAFVDIESMAEHYGREHDREDG